MTEKAIEQRIVAAAKNGFVFTTDLDEADREIGLSSRWLEVAGIGMFALTDTCIKAAAK